MSCIQETDVYVLYNLCSSHRLARRHFHVVFLPLIVKYQFQTAESPVECQKLDCNPQTSNENTEHYHSIFALTK